MKYVLKKSVSFLLAVLLTGVFSVRSDAFSADQNITLRHADGTTKSFSSIVPAVAASVSGDVISLAGEVCEYDTSAGVVITNAITLEVGKDSNGVSKKLTYSGTDAPMFTVERGGRLTVTNSYIFGNANSTLRAGGFVLVKEGGVLILDGEEGSEVMIQNFILKADNAKGGAIYVEKGGTVIVNGAVFADNCAAQGDNIYAEDEADVIYKNNPTEKTPAPERTEAPAPTETPTAEDKSLEGINVTEGIIIYGAVTVCSTVFAYILLKKKKKK